MKMNKALTEGLPMTSRKLWELPACHTRVFFGRRHPYCVVVFVINEGERIRRQLNKMKGLAEQADIIIADGGSTDGSLPMVFLREQGVRTMLIKTGAGRLSAQMRMAFAYALDEGYDGIVTMDGNDKDDPLAVPAFLNALERGYDHIQGSRYIKGGKGVNTPLSRHLAVSCIHAPLISLASGYRYTDTTNGFRAYSRKFLLDERVLPFRNVFAGYELHYYLAIRAARLGFNVCEVPVVRSYPPGGMIPTKISLIRGNAEILKTLFSACLGRFNPRR